VAGEQCTAKDDVARRSSDQIFREVNTL